MQSAIIRGTMNGVEQTYDALLDPAYNTIEVSGTFFPAPEAALWLRWFGLEDASFEIIDHKSEAEDIVRDHEQEEP